jgi:hypothetical protein
LASPSGKGKGKSNHLALEMADTTQSWAKGGKGKAKGKDKGKVQVDPAAALVEGKKKLDRMIKMLAAQKTKAQVAGFAVNADKNKRRLIVNAVTQLEQQSAMLSDLHKEDPGNTAIHWFIAYGCYGLGVLIIIMLMNVMCA